MLERDVTLDGKHYQTPIAYEGLFDGVPLRIQSAEAMTLMRWQELTPD